MKYTAGRSFVDSNIWCYMAHAGDEAKRSIATKLVETLVPTGLAVVSTQVLNETFSVMTRKLGVNPMRAKAAIQQMGSNNLVVIDLTTIEKAIDISITEQLSYWDALMVSSAVKSNCLRLFTEDLQHDRTIQGIQIVNPFIP